MAVVARKRVVFSNHARKRLTERRQEGVTEWDVHAACQLASEILTHGVPEKMKLRGFRSKTGVMFEIVVVDSGQELLIVSVIGHKHTKRRGYCPQDVYRLHDLPYKEQIKAYRRRRKEEMKWYK
jgi:hypothetical protein